MSRGLDSKDCHHLKGRETDVCACGCVSTGRFAVRDMRQTVAVGVIKGVTKTEKEDAGGSKGNKTKKK